MTRQYAAMRIIDKRNWPVSYGVLGLLLALLPARALAQDVPAAPATAPPPTPAPPAMSNPPANTSMSTPDTAPPPVRSETSSKEVCGHVGVAIPLIMMDHPTKNIGDQLNIAAPIGIGIKLSNRLVFDFETVIATHIKQGDKPTGLTIDPGVVYDLGPLAAGLRVKWDIGAPPNIGLIPLLHRGIVDLGGATWFVEGVFPITYVTKNVNFDVVIHTGIAF